MKQCPITLEPCPWAGAIRCCADGRIMPERDRDDDEIIPTGDEAPAIREPDAA